MKIEIQEISDEMNCETCGGTWATGFNVDIDGKPFGDYSPSAHCFGGTSFTLDQVLVDILTHLGHEVVFRP